MYEDGEQIEFIIQKLDENGNYLLTTPEQDTLEVWQDIKAGETLESAVQSRLSDYASELEVLDIIVESIDLETEYVLCTLET